MFHPQHPHASTPLSPFHFPPPTWAEGHTHCLQQPCGKLPACHTSRCLLPSTLHAFSLQILVQCLNRFVCATLCSGHSGWRGPPRSLSTSPHPTHPHPPHPTPPLETWDVPFTVPCCLHHTPSALVRQAGISSMHTPALPIFYDCIVPPHRQQKHARMVPTAPFDRTIHLTHIHMHTYHTWTFWLGPQPGNAQVSPAHMLL